MTDSFLHFYETEEIQERYILGIIYDAEDENAIKRTEKGRIQLRYGESGNPKGFESDAFRNQPLTAIG